MQFVTSCLFGLEKFVGEDIDRLGYKRIETIDGRVTFEGDISAVARCNTNFRYSERLYIKLGDFNAYTFTELFDNVEKLNFSEFIGRDDAIVVTGSSVRSKLFSVRDCQSIIKKAIIKSLEKSYKMGGMHMGYGGKIFVSYGTRHIALDIRDDLGKHASLSYSYFASFLIARFYKKR